MLFFLSWEPRVSQWQTGLGLGLFHVSWAAAVCSSWAELGADFLEIVSYMLSVFSSFKM